MTDSNGMTERRDTDYRPCDSRYRSSKYFMQDQLKCSQAADDFRSVKNLLSGLANFQNQLAFQYQRVRAR
jgi:hypothetical protein